MKLLDWYIGRTIVASTLMTWFVLASVSSLFRFIDQLKAVGKGSYDILHAGLFTLYSVPTDIEVFFPMAALIGGLIGLGGLASNSELVVMQGAGVSRLSIVNSVLKAAVVMILVVMAIAEWGAPEALKTAKELKARAISNGSLISASQGVWAKDGKKFINISDVSQTGELQHLTIYEFNDDLKIKNITSAIKGVFKPEAERWLLTDVTNLTFSEEQITKTKQKKVFWSSTLTPDKVGVVSIKHPEYLSMNELSRYLDYLSSNNQEGSRYELAFWRKVFQPFSIAVMLLVASSFIFGPLRSTSMGARIVLGITVGFLFYMTNQIFGPVALVYELPPILGALVPSTIFVLIATFYLNRRM